MKLKSLITSLSIFALVTGCHGHGDTHVEDHDHEAEEHGHEHGGADEIVLSPADAQKFGVEVEGIVPAPFADVVKTSGEIMPSTADRATVTSKTAGIVHLSPSLNPGAQLSAGQSVGSVSAKNISGGDTNQAALKAIENAKRELDRVTPLLADGLVTKKEYNDALAAYEAAKAAYSPSAASGSLTSPRSGVVTQVLVREGQYVEAGQPIAEVASSNRLTLRALLPSTQASFLPLISSAVITPHGGDPVDISSLGGTLTSARPASGADTPGYIPVYFTFSGTDPSIVPGTAAEVYLKASPRGEVISVPVEALSEQMGEMFVFVKIDDHGYTKRPVKVGRSDGMRAEILEGVSPGDSVVSKGMTFVRLAQQATVVPEGHSHSH